MSATIKSNAELIEELKKFIALPSHLVSLDLRMRQNEAPSLTLETYVVGPDGKPELDAGALDLKRETTVFDLVPRQDFIEYAPLEDQITQRIPFRKP